MYSSSISTFKQGVWKNFILFFSREIIILIKYGFFLTDGKRGKIMAKIQIEKL